MVALARRAGRTCATGFVLLAGLCVACDGRFRVGEMDIDHAPTSAGGSSALVGTGGSSTVGGTEPDSSPLAGGAGGDNTVCDVPTFEVAALEPPFEAPDVVWKRLSLWLNGDIIESPIPLPQSTTYKWAGQVAVAAFTLSEQLDVNLAAHAKRRYLESSFDLEPGSTALNTWTTRLKESGDPLQLLYATPGDDHRMGIFGDQEWLTRHPRAVSRGISVLRGVFNQLVPAPPPNAKQTLPEDRGDLTMRELLEQHRTDSTCDSCHGLIDPVGLSLEHFDEAGNYRESYADKPIDSSDTYRPSFGGEQFTFTSMEDLSPQFVSSCQARLSFADLHLERAMLDAGLLDADEDIAQTHQEDLARVRQAFLRQQDYPTLILAIAHTSAFLR
jgi:hypothetical protein